MAGAGKTSQLYELPLWFNSHSEHVKSLAGVNNILAIMCVPIEYGEMRGEDFSPSVLIQNIIFLVLCEITWVVYD